VSNCTREIARRVFEEWGREPGTGKKHLYQLIWSKAVKPEWHVGYRDRGRDTSWLYYEASITGKKECGATRWLSLVMFYLCVDVC
jgi:hypothetical protein